MKKIFDSMFRKTNKSLMFLFAGRGLQAVLSVLTIRFMTELISPIEVGNQYLINSIVLWFGLVLINPVGMYINRHLHEWRDNHEMRFYLKKINKYFLAVACLSLPIIFIMQTYFKLGGSVPVFQLQLFAFFYILIGIWYQTTVSFLNLFEYQKMFVSLNVFSQLMGLALACIIVNFFRADAIGWMFGLLSGQIVTSIVLFLYLNKMFPKGTQSNIPPQNKLYDLSAFKFCYPVALTTIFIWFLNQGYRLLVEKNLGAQTLAEIGVGFGIALGVLGSIEVIVTQYFYPKYYASLNNATYEKRKEAWLNLWSNTTGIYILSAGLVFSMSHLILRLLASSQFQHVIGFVLVGFLIEFFKQNSNIMYISAHGERDTKGVILPYMFGAIFLACGFLYGAHYNQLTVNLVAGILLASHMLTYIFNVVQMKKILKVTLNLKIVWFSFLFALPFGLIFFISTQQGSIISLIGLAFVSIFWGALSFFYLNKLIRTNNS